MAIDLSYQPDARLLATVAAYGGAGPVAEQGQMQGAQLDQAFYSGLNTIADNARQNTAQQLAAIKQQQDAAHQADQSAQGWQGLYQSGLNQAQQVQARAQASHEAAAQREADRQGRYDVAALGHASQADLEDQRQANRMDLQGYGAQNRSDLMEQKYGALDTMRLAEIDRQETNAHAWLDSMGVPRDPSNQQRAAVAMQSNSSRQGISPRWFPRPGTIAGQMGTPGQAGQQGGQQGGQQQQQPWRAGVPVLAMNQQGNAPQDPAADQGGEVGPPQGGAQPPVARGQWVTDEMPNTFRHVPTGNVYQQVQGSHGPELRPLLQQERPPAPPDFHQLYDHASAALVRERTASGNLAPVTDDEIRARMHSQHQTADTFAREQRTPPDQRPGYNPNGPEWERRPNIDYSPAVPLDANGQPQGHTREQLFQAQLAEPSLTAPQREIINQARALEMRYGNREGMPRTWANAPGWPNAPFQGRTTDGPRQLYEQLLSDIAGIGTARQLNVPTPGGLEIGQAYRDSNTYGGTAAFHRRRAELQAAIVARRADLERVDRNPIVLPSIRRNIMNAYGTALAALQSHLSRADEPLPGD